MDDEVDRLYGLPLEEFVPERDALAKRLRGEKRREDADAVKALRKPSVAAWAVNQVLRARPDEQRALLEAGDAQRAAQDDLLGGSGDAAAARAAGETERKVVGELVAAARGLAREKGFLSEPVLDRVRETLHAASTDDDARAEVEAARVSREWRPASFGGLEGFAASTRAPAKRTDARTPARERKARGRSRSREAEERGKAAERAADERRREHARKAEERDRERERSAQERERRLEAEAALKEAKAEQRDAARRRREAEAAVTAAERELGDLRADLEAAVDEERAAEERRAAAEEALSAARAG